MTRQSRIGVCYVVVTMARLVRLTTVMYKPRSGYSPDF